MPFIVLEGLDGAGKSTQLEKLVSYFREQGREYEFQHFPRYDSPVFGELISRFLRGELGDIDTVDPYVVALLFAGDRADASRYLNEWLREGKAVLTDRYVYSNIAFQGAKIHNDEDRQKLAVWIENLEFEYYKIPRPDISIFLDVPFRFTEERLRANREGEDREYLCGSRDIHEESMEFQAAVRKVYIDKAAVDPKLKIVDCSDGKGNMDTPDNIFSRIISIVESVTGNER